MSKIEIYADYKAFENRQDKTVNGVSKEWLDKHSLIVEKLKLITLAYTQLKNTYREKIDN